MAARTRTDVTGCLLGVLLIVVSTSAKSANQIAKSDVSTFYTSSKFVYHKWLQMLTKTDVVFQLKACSDGHLTLAHYRDATYNATVSEVTEVVLSGWENTRSVIRNGTGLNRAVFTSYKTNELLHCAEFRTFWISWRHGSIRVGRGPIVGEQIMMRVSRSGSLFHPIQFVGFSTGYGHSGTWKIEQNQGFHLYVWTPEMFGYNHVWRSLDKKANPGIKFRVMSCKNVHIALSNKQGTTHYEIAIGNHENGKIVTELRYGGSVKASYTDDKILDCTHLRYFWVYWFEGTIHVGTGGQWGLNEIMKWKDSAFVQINYYSVSTGYESSGLFAFEDNLENTFWLKSTKSNLTTPSYELFVDTPRQDQMTFRLQACGSAYIALSQSTYVLSDDTYHVYLGIDGNKRSGAYRGRQRIPVVDIATPELLSCDHMEEFWIRWPRNRVEIGRGFVYGMSTIFSFQIDSPTRFVNTLGFANTHNDQALWEVTRNSGANVNLRTGTVKDYNHLIVSTTQDLYTTFNVRACYNAHIMLGSIDGARSRDAYEVILGKDGSKTAIKGLRPGSPSIEKATPETLACTEMRSFWVGWVDSRIRVGRGHRFGQLQLASLEEPVPLLANGISVTTEDTPGTWQFESDTGDYFEAKIEAYSNFGTWVSIFPWHTWTYFKVSSTHDACMFLSPTLRDTSKGYRICFGALSNTAVTLERDGKLVQTGFKPNVLHYIDQTEWWVSWDNGEIALGTGKLKGFQPLLKYEDHEIYHVQAAQLLSGKSGSKAAWKIYEYQTREFEYQTVPEQIYDMWLSLRHRTHLPIGIKSCGNVEIVLSAVMHSMNPDYTYTIVIQDDQQKTSIWEGTKKKKLIEVDTPDILDCDEERYFWLSWYGGHIVLGLGQHHGDNVLIGFQELNGLDLRALSINTPGHDGEWRFTMANFYGGLMERHNGALTGGEIAAVVVGLILILILFLLASIVIIHPPKSLKPLLTSSVPEENIKYEKHEEEAAHDEDPSLTTIASRSFENPMAEIDLEQQPTQ